MQRMYQQKSFSCVIWGVQGIKQFHTLHHIKICLFISWIILALDLAHLVIANMYSEIKK